MKFFSNAKLILAVFVALKVIQTVYSFQTFESPILLPFLRLAEVVFLIPFACLAAKGRTPALFIVGLVLLLQIFPVTWGIFLISFKQYIFKTVVILLSSYFVFGGYRLVQQGWDNLIEA